jgi:hypothetical protein
MKWSQFVKELILREETDDRVVVVVEEYGSN